MTLIADGGSTKCDWILLDAKGEVLVKTRTKGLNPALIPYDELVNRISENAKSGFERISLPIINF